MTDDLSKAIASYIDGRGDGAYETAVPGLTMMRRSEPQEMPRHMLFRRALCVVAQGGKRLMLGDASWDYAAGQALVVGLEMPALGRVVEASTDEPYLGLNIDLDPAMLQEVIEALGSPPRPSDGGPSLFVADMDAALTDSVLRLVKLLDHPAGIPVLQPAIMRELSYWLLTGPHGSEIARLALPDGHARRIANAVRLLRDNFDKPVRMEELAAEARMSPSSFYEHFKTLTSMSPLQYQKQLRLLEARRLMLAEQVNVESAAFSVGYESPSQFSREYARMFGTAPKRDVTNLRESTAAVELVTAA